MTRTDYLSIANVGVAAVSCTRLVLIGAEKGAGALCMSLAFVVVIAAVYVYAWEKYR